MYDLIYMILYDIVCIAENHGITPHSMLNNHKPKVKRMIIDTAREWPYYFARLFHVKVKQLC